ncbi:MAG: hypothetical protein WAN11_10235 [Syntrophobacteraceae bacterium]
MGDKSKVFRIFVLFYILVLIAGCEPSHIAPVQNVVPPPPPSFLPQTVMQTGDYAGFLAENSEALKSCEDPDKCTIALFNLSFLHCYPKSPYYDPQRGLKYIQDLIAAAPGSPWTFQAIVWKDLIETNMPKKIKKRPATREGLKGKESPEVSEAPEEDLAKSSEGTRESETDWVADRQRLEDEIISKEEIIKELSRQLERSRQIDIEMEKKERGLPN